jgi:hypothetical protein
MPNNALHRTAIPLRSIAAGELGRLATSASPEIERRIEPTEMVVKRGLAPAAKRAKSGTATGQRATGDSPRFGSPFCLRRVAGKA